MTDSPVIARVEGRVGRLTLNRPGALHALTHDMCALMMDALTGWLTDAHVDAVLIDHAGERGFCAGGDIRMLAESGAGDAREARAFFHLEYQLNALLFYYPKPVIAVMDGVTMGGGVGLAMPARIRIATERTTFAMPETGIGLFPDVGGGWHLPRLPGRTGLWLALTGARLKGADCRALGIATHLVAASDIEAIKAEIIADPAGAEAALVRRSAPPADAPVNARRAEIDRLYGGESVEAILTALAADPSATAAADLATLRTKSPQTLKVAFRQLKLGAAFTDFVDNMELEYRIASRVVSRHDFLEGVRAVIVDKDNAPRWRPARVEDVPDADIDTIFAPLPPEETWRAPPVLKEIRA